MTRLLIQVKYKFKCLRDRARTNPGEVNDIPYDPILEVIHRECNKRTKTEPVICLQIHPQRWSINGFEIFAKATDELIKNGHCFIR